MTTILRSWIEGLRWAGIDTLIETLAFELDLDLDIKVKKVFPLRSRVFYKVEGDQESVEKFQHLLVTSIKEYEKVNS